MRVGAQILKEDEREGWDETYLLNLGSLVLELHVKLRWWSLMLRR
jgi:hypothetical protein